MSDAQAAENKDTVVQAGSAVANFFDGNWGAMAANIAKVGKNLFSSAGNAAVTSGYTFQGSYDKAGYHGGFLVNTTGGNDVVGNIGANIADLTKRTMDKFAEFFSANPDVVIPINIRTAPSYGAQEIGIEQAIQNFAAAHPALIGASTAGAAGTALMAGGGVGVSNHISESGVIETEAQSGFLNQYVIVGIITAIGLIFLFLRSK